MRLSGILWCWVGIGFGLLSSCSDRDMNLDDEETTPGGGGGGGGDVSPPSRWRCLNDPPMFAPGAAATEPSSSQSLYGVLVLDSAAMAPMMSLDLAVCQIVDSDCRQPILTGSPVGVEDVINPPLTPPDVMTDPEGWLVFLLPDGFEGYLQLEAPAYMPTDYYFGGPLRQSESILGYPILLQPMEMWDRSLYDLGVPIEPGTGALTVRALDCDTTKSAGVRLSLNGAGTPWVLRNGLMTRNDDGELETDTTGMAGFVNVPPGVVLIEGRAQVSCAAGSDCPEDTPWEVVSSVSTRVRPGRITLVELRHDYSYGR
jgi:hypothetical protein